MRIFSVVFIANYPKDQLLNTTYRKVWVDQQVDYALSNDLGILLTLSFLFLKQNKLKDGVNFDFEDDLESNSAEAGAYTKLFKATVAEFHRRVPRSQV